MLSTFKLSPSVEISKENFHNQCERCTSDIRRAGLASYTPLLKNLEALGLKDETLLLGLLRDDLS